MGNGEIANWLERGGDYSYQEAREGPIKSNELQANIYFLKSIATSQLVFSDPALFSPWTSKLPFSFTNWMYGCCQAVTPIETGQ